MVDKADNKEQNNNLDENFSWELDSLKKNILWNTSEKTKDESVEKREDKKVKSNSEIEKSINSKLDFLNDKINATLDDVELDEKLKQWVDEETVDKFFEKWKNELTDNKTTNSEKKFISKSSYIADRPNDVVEWINDSADEILNEIQNRKQEQNPVARSLLRIVNWIMKSEK
jgi:uncharacterized protein YjgD (DUF1641 family)